MTEADPSPEESDRTTKALAAKEAHGAFLLGLPNVVGVGVGLRTRRGELTSEVAVVVMVSRKFPDVALAPHELIPKELDGIPVDVLEVGDLRAGGLSGI